MKPSHSNKIADTLEQLLSAKVDRTGPRSGFAGRVLAHLPADSGRKRGIAGYWAGAIAAGAAAAALIGLAMIQLGGGGDRSGLLADAAVDAEPTAGLLPDGSGGVETLTKLPSLTASWPALPLEGGLRAESDAFRKDVEQVSAFLVRAIPRFPERHPADS